MKRRTSREKGNALLEFTLVGIPLIFVLISIFEMARGMWIYDTLAHAVKEGTRYAAVHGVNCVPVPSDPSSNDCAVSIADIAARIQNAGVGLPADQLTLTFSAGSGAPTTCLLQNCLTLKTKPWPPSPNNAAGLPVSISGVFPFQSAIAFFWPGVARSMIFPTFNLPASAREAIQF